MYKIYFIDMIKHKYKLTDNEKIIMSKLKNDLHNFLKFDDSIKNLCCEFNTINKTCQFYEDITIL